MRHFTGGAHLRVNQDVRLPIVRLAFRQQLTNPAQRILGLQQGSMRLMPHPLPDGLGRRPETDDKRVLAQSVQVKRIGGQPPPVANTARRR